MANTNQRKKRRHSGFYIFITTFFKVIGTLLLIGVITGGILACFASIYITTVIMPEAPLDVTEYSTSLASTVYYTDSTTGQDVELISLYGTENRVWVTYDDIPEDLINATVAIEDRRFWTHNGVDWSRTAYAVFSMFTGQDIQGGSTLTQQLIKNITDYDDVTVKRKILEIFRALDFDKTYSKETILEMYLNYIYLGDGCYGVSTAARTYFDKDVGDLTLAECASLIAITNNPSIYSPYLYDGVYNRERQETILWTMWDQGIITEEEYDEAMAEEMVFARGEDEDRVTTIFTWYEEQLITDVTNDLMEQYGLSETAAQDAVYRGGLNIYSCVDPDVQAIVDEVYENQENLNVISPSGQQLESSIVIIDPDGNIVGMSGGMGEKTGNRLWNMASDTVRQPGSSIKPLSVYTPALEMGLITPYTIVDDTAVRVESGSAWPSNSYGSYYGRTTVIDALRVSSNPVALRVLQAVTPAASFAFMEEKFHFTSLESGRESWGQWVSDMDEAPLSMGGLTDGVSVLEMAAAYSTFPRGGVYVEPRTYTRVEDADGNIILDNTSPTTEAIMKESTAWYMNEMLQEVVTSTGTGRTASLPGITFAGKTGSTNSNNDRWFVGYSSYYTAAVWCGYSNLEAISYGSGYDNPSIDMWNLVMQPLHEGLEDKDFDAPDNLVTAAYCKDSGMIPCDACALDVRGSRTAYGTFVAGDQPTQYCDMHVEVEVCTACQATNYAGTAITGLYCMPSEYCLYEPVGDMEATVTTVSLLDYTRAVVDGAKSPNDYYYLKSTWELLGMCTVHTEPIVLEEELEDSSDLTYDPSTFDRTDPTTWPPEELYPYFDENNSNTWPSIDLPSVSVEPDDVEVPDDSEAYVPVA